jgi:hypothetical protein
MEISQVVRTGGATWQLARHSAVSVCVQVVERLADS